MVPVAVLSPRRGRRAPKAKARVASRSNSPDGKVNIVNMDVKDGGRVSLHFGGVQIKSLSTGSKPYLKKWLAHMHPAKVGSGSGSGADSAAAVPMVVFVPKQGSPQERKVQALQSDALHEMCFKRHAVVLSDDSQAELMQALLHSDGAPAAPHTFRAYDDKFQWTLGAGGRVLNLKNPGATPVVPDVAGAFRVEEAPHVVVVPVSVLYNEMTHE